MLFVRELDRRMVGAIMSHNSPRFSPGDLIFETRKVGDVYLPGPILVLDVNESIVHYMPKKYVYTLLVEGKVRRLTNDYIDHKCLFLTEDNLSNK